MNCHEVQDALLAQLDGFLPADSEVASHLATCPECSRFEALHRNLDRQLASAMPLAALTPQFRQALCARLPEHAPSSTWADFLPDLAHVTGCAVAVAILMVLMPEYSRTVLYTGAGFTAVSYFLQALIRNSLDRQSL